MDGREEVNDAVAAVCPSDVHQPQQHPEEGDQRTDAQRLVDGQQRPGRHPQLLDHDEAEQDGPQTGQRPG